MSKNGLTGKFLPTFEIHLVPTEMEIFLRKHLCDLLKESLDKGVDPLLGWVERPVVAILLTTAIVAPTRLAHETD